MLKCARSEAVTKSYIEVMKKSETNPAYSF